MLKRYAISFLNIVLDERDIDMIAFMNSVSGRNNLFHLSPQFISQEQRPEDKEGKYKRPESKSMKRLFRDFFKSKGVIKEA